MSACAPETDSGAGSTADSGSDTTGKSTTTGSADRPGVSGSAAAAAAGRDSGSSTTQMPSTGSGGSRAAGVAGGGTMQARPGGAGASATATGGRAGTAANGGAAGKPTAGAGGASSGAAANGETGRMAGMTAAHNAVRARITNPTPMPALPPLKWSSDIAQIAQAYADKLAAGGNCLNLVHSMRDGYGENLAGYMGSMADPMEVVEGWAAEEECWSYGPISRDDSNCDMTCARSKQSSGCGHYTQVVWRDTSEVGCGVALCGSGRQGGEVWVCNYRAPGNFIGEKPY